MEKTTLELIKEYIDKNFPDLTPEEKDKKVRSHAQALLRV